MPCRPFFSVTRTPGTCDLTRPRILRRCLSSSADIRVPVSGMITVAVISLNRRFFTLETRQISSRHVLSSLSEAE